jgi:hypothetical protein
VRTSIHILLNLLDSNGQVYNFGSNQNGAFANFAYPLNAVAGPVLPTAGGVLPSNISVVSQDGDTNYASNGTHFWSFGQCYPSCGTGQTGDYLYYVSTPEKILINPVRMKPVSGNPRASIGMNYRNQLYLNSDGGLTTIGYNGNGNYSILFYIDNLIGQCGDGSSYPRSDYLTPYNISIPSAVKPFVYVSATRQGASVAIDSTGQIFGW